MPSMHMFVLCVCVLLPCVSAAVTAALAAAAVVVSGVQDGLQSIPKDSLVCNEQQYIGLEDYSKNVINPFEAITKLIKEGECCFRWACLSCEKGKFMSKIETSVYCHECPLFAPATANPKSTGPRWCNIDPCPNPKEALHMIAPSQSSPVCVNTKNWKDSFGDGCSEYEKDPEPCGIEDSKQHCCVCGKSSVLSTTMVQTQCKPCPSGTSILTTHPSSILLSYQSELLTLGFMQPQINQMISEQNLFGKHFDVLKWKICVACPSGMIPHTSFDPAGAEFLTDKIFNSVPTSSDFLCKACSVDSGIREGIKCKTCKKEEYQHAELNSINLMVGVKCQICEPGTGLASIGRRGEFADGRNFACRSSNKKDCCDKCETNYYGKEGKCQKAPEMLVGITYMPSFMPVPAGTKEWQVNAGAQYYRACTNEERFMKVTPSLIPEPQHWHSPWKICIPCSFDMTMRNNPGQSGCVKCSGNEHFRSSDDPNKCSSCTSCEEVIEKTKLVDLYDLQEIFDVTQREVYTIPQVTAQCNPLTNETVRKNQFDQLEITGECHHRPVSTRKGLKIDPYHFVQRFDGQCIMKHCTNVCDGYHYSDGCGTQTKSNKKWVKYSLDGKEHIMKLEQIKVSSDIDFATWMVLTEGKCHACKPCLQGYYNKHCNTENSYKNDQPEGECEPCLNSCPSGQFMLHPVKDAGCHDPSTANMAKDTTGLWEIQSNYECKKCPKWVKQGETLQAVVKCGVNEKYEHFDLSDLTQSKEYDVQFTLKENSPILTTDPNTPRKNFLTFLTDAEPYCPPSYFFNANRKNCNFINNGEPMTLPNQKQMIVGYNDYSPQCCELCKNCLAPLHFRDQSNWKQCLGDSVVDVQNHCYDKCPPGSWLNKLTDTSQECRLCSTCHRGIISSN